MSELIIGGMHYVTDNLDRLHFWGEVFNQGDSAQRWVRVSIKLLGDGGEPLAEESDICGLEWTLPGSRNPFYIRFRETPRNWRTYSIAFSGHTHDAGDSSVPQPHLGVRAIRVHYREIERADLRCSLIGLLTNPSLTPATHVKVAGTLYGPNGRVVGVLSPYLVPRGVLTPGDSLAFELKYYALGGIVSDYAVQAQGRMLQGP